MTIKKQVVIGLLGTTKDKRGKGEKRWNSWRPTVSLFMHEDIQFDRLEMICQPNNDCLAYRVADDVSQVSPDTKVNFHDIEFKNPWDFEEVYQKLYDFCAAYDFKPESEEYYLNITTGTHVAQICWFLLCEANYLPAKLIQSSPDAKNQDEPARGTYSIIDLDLSKYDVLAQRFEKQSQDDQALLKRGIQTKSAAFNQMISQIELVAGRSDAPMLFTGPTGAGKSHLAKQVFELRKQKHLLSGEFVAVNCATLKGDNAMSALFGHQKGAFTGAANARQGLLKTADQGLLFLDEIGELGLDEQAMLLHAIEDKRFFPLGSDKAQSSDFQLIAGTNRNLYDAVQRGEFRDDLLARINIWSYELPGLSQRKEDIEPNLDYELAKYEQEKASLVNFNSDARLAYVKFAKSTDATWSGNFRDLNASVLRMVTLAQGGRINLENVQQEISRLAHHWQAPTAAKSTGNTEIDLERWFDQQQLDEMDMFDQMQLKQVIQTCQQSRSLSDAGRKLFNYSRTQKASNNDSHRLRIYLAKFGLKFEMLEI